MVVLKNSAEIQAMEKACRISAEALQLAGELIQPGMSTKELDRKLHEYIKKQGAVPSFLGYGGFPGCACISLNDQVIHGIPSDKVIIKEGDIVKVDVGAYIDGYHGDNAATYGVGEISPEAKQLMDATKESLHKAIEMAVPGNRLGDIGYAVQSHVEQFGFAVVRDYVGHGVGHNLHESPEVPNYGKPGHGTRLLPGMTIAIEPMINAKGAEVKVMKDGWTVLTVSGSLSAHFEHTIAITSDGPVILTRP